jgi:hypothetical protein
MGLPLLLSTIPAHRASRSLPFIRYPTYLTDQKNKFQNPGAFLAFQKHQAKAPRSTSNPPQTHQRKTTLCTPFSQETPQKPPSTSSEKNQSRGSSIRSKTCAI